MQWLRVVRTSELCLELRSRLFRDSLRKRWTDLIKSAPQLEVSKTIIVREARYFTCERHVHVETFALAVILSRDIAMAQEVDKRNQMENLRSRLRAGTVIARYDPWTGDFRTERNILAE
jgi:hypothetical protein